MYAAASLFDVETEAGTMVVTPQASWFGVHGAAESEAAALLQRLEAETPSRILLDLGQTRDCDSSALGFCTQLWKQVRGRGGRIALCNLSDSERQMLQVTKLDRLWPIYASRREALAALRK